MGSFVFCLRLARSFMIFHYFSIYFNVCSSFACLTFIKISCFVQVI